MVPGRENEVKVLTALQRGQLADGAKMGPGLEPALCPGPPCSPERGLDLPTQDVGTPGVAQMNTDEHRWESLSQSRKAAMMRQDLDSPLSLPSS